MAVGYNCSHFCVHRFWSFYRSRSFRFLYISPETFYLRSVQRFPDLLPSGTLKCCEIWSLHTLRLPSNSLVLCFRDWNRRTPIWPWYLLSTLLYFLISDHQLMTFADRGRFVMVSFFMNMMSSVIAGFPASVAFFPHSWLAEFLSSCYAGYHNASVVRHSWFSCVEFTFFVGAVAIVFSAWSPLNRLVVSQPANIRASGKSGEGGVALCTNRATSDFSSYTYPQLNVFLHSSGAHSVELINPYPRLCTSASSFARLSFMTYRLTRNWTMAEYDFNVPHEKKVDEFVNVINVL